MTLAEKLEFMRLQGYTVTIKGRPEMPEDYRWMAGVDDLPYENGDTIDEVVDAVYRKFLDLAGLMSKDEVEIWYVEMVSKAQTEYQEVLRSIESMKEALLGK